MSSRPLLTRIRQYLITFIGFLLAFLLREAFVPHFGYLPPYAIFFPLVVVASIFGNLWTGLISTALSVMAVCYWMLFAQAPFALKGASYPIRTVIFSILGICISIAADRFHRSRDRYLEFQIDQALKCERSRAEKERTVAEATYAERQRFLDVLETLPQMICLLKEDHSLAFANRSFREKFGVFEGRHCYENCFGRMRPCDNCERARVFQTGERLHWEVTILDGTVIEVYALPFRDVDGSMLVLEMGVDISERKRTENELRDYREHLEQLVRERTSQLETANAQLEADIAERKLAEQALLRSEKLASAGRLAASIAHEINNPLEAVTNTLYLARMMAQDPEAVRKYLDIADDELKGIAHITRQALGFYRESNAPALTSVTAVLDSSIDLLSGKIKAKHVLIHRQWHSEVKICAVAGELRQVFSNLLANSIDALGDSGSIKLRVSGRAFFRDGSRAVRVTVSDNGRGIHPEAQQHIFEPFFTTKGSVGTGLGLWVSKQIVDNHGGIIRVRSSCHPGHSGTTFSILIPIDLDEAHSKQAKHQDGANQELLCAEPRL